MPKQYDPPIKISIPIPSHIPRARGIHSTNSYGGNLRVRCSNDEYDAAQREAEMLGVSLAGFCRWCITHVAAALYKHRSEKSTADVVEVDYSGK